MTLKIGENLKQARLDKGYSQVEVAEKLSLSRTAITNYESDTRRPSYEILIELCELYDISLDYVFGLSEL